MARVEKLDPGMNMAQGAGEVAASAALGDRAAIDASADALALIASQARSWLFESAAELWRAEPGGGTPLLPECMSIHGERDACPHRLFVQARHIFSHCELGRLGWSGPRREMVAADIDFLVEKGRRSDGFFVHRFDYRGAVFDGRADLYDQVHAARFRPCGAIAGAPRAVRGR
jgi:mannose/cellobiose epimerase-like protein (N-acyl-D-glucosamine 2-epimerase family)